MEDKTPSQIETECLAEISEVLKKHSCTIQVSFQKETVLGQPVLTYEPIVVFTKTLN